MNLRRNNPTAALAAGGLLCAALLGRAAVPTAGWQYQQSFDAPSAGLLRISLPAATLDLARPGLEDLRLLDADGNEVPFVIERPRPATRQIQPAKWFAAALEDSATVLNLENGLTNPVNAVALITPAESFIKAVQVQGSTDGKQWRTLVTGQPVFRQAGGTSQLRVTFPAGTWPWLRLRIDDRRSGPIPFTGATVFAADPSALETDTIPVTIAERYENPGITRLTLKLPAANLDIASLQIESSDPLFTRHLTLAVPKVSESGVREETVASGAIFRMSLEGEPTSANLKLMVDSTIRSRELVLLIHNLDSPALAVQSVKAERYPVYLTFFARNQGIYRLLTANAQAAAPRYDVASLGDGLKKTPVTQLAVSAPQPNPGYRPPEALSGIQEGATDIDVAEWKFRKAIVASRAGAQQVELDLEVLANAQSGFADLRLVRNGQQLPFILERTSISRALTPEVSTVKDPKHPDLSRWSLKFSHPNLPLSSLRFETRTALFNRDLAVYELREDSRGDPYRVDLTRGTWVRTPQSRPEFALTLDGNPRRATLLLDTRNGDNPPIELGEFRAHYPVSRILFKVSGTNDLFLYYGNPAAAHPQYDLSLVANQLVVADKATATTGPEQQVKPTSWAEGRTPGKGGLVFWAILGLVVASLLFIIARLVPKGSQP